jgi:putative membrane protein
VTGVRVTTSAPRPTGWSSAATSRPGATSTRPATSTTCAGDDGGVTDPEHRWPSSVYAHGQEPDPRFSLANERTFLAWIGTSLALIAAGVALDSFANDIHPVFKLVAAVLLIATGISLPFQAWFGWLRTERALRTNRALPAPMLALPLGIAVSVAGIVVVVGILLA